jgi:hypothetical protein
MPGQHEKVLQKTTFHHCDFAFQSINLPRASFLNHGRLHSQSAASFGEYGWDISRNGMCGKARMMAWAR